MVRERPYISTRADFTRRAYDPNASALGASGGAVSASLDTLVTSVPSQQLLRQDSLAYPGARGLVVVTDPQLDVAGPPLGDGLSRWQYAWAYQTFDLLSDSIPRRARQAATASPAGPPPTMSASVVISMVAPCRLFCMPGTLVPTIPPTYRAHACGAPIFPGQRDS